MAISANLRETPLTDASGKITREWIRFLNSQSSATDNPATDAPNVTAATVGVEYGMWANDSAYALKASISLPASREHLKKIHIVADGVDGDIGTLYAPWSESPIEWRSGDPDIHQERTPVTRTLTFLCENENGKITRNPLTASVNVRPSGVESVTASEVGTRRVQEDNRLEWMTVGIVPHLAGGQYPQNVTYWISADNGVTFVWIGWDVVREDGQVLKIDRLVPGADSAWKVAVISGAVGGNPTPIVAADLPVGVVVSPSFVVLGLELPANNAVTDASILDVEGTSSKCVTRSREDNSKYGEMGLIQWTDPTDLSFFARVTVQELDATHTPITVGDGVERVHDGQQIVSGAVRTTTRPLLIVYKPDLAYIRVRIYVANRNSQNTNDFQDPTTNTLQSCWPGGADHYDVAVPMVTVTAVTGTEAGDRYAQLDNRLVHLYVDITPTFDSADSLPANFTYWISSDNGAHWVWLAWQLVTTVGQTFRVDRLAPGADQTWKVAAHAGAIGGNPVPILESDLPDGTVISDGFTVVSMPPPADGLVTSLTYATGAGGANPYNVVAPPRQYWSISGIGYDDTGCLVDPNAFFVRITATDLDSSHNPVGAERPYGGTQVSETGASQVNAPLTGEYGTVGDGYVRSGDIDYVRLKAYVCNRLDQTGASFSNALAATLQTAATVDILVGPPPPPLELGTGIYTDVITGGHISPDLQHGPDHQVFLVSDSAITVDDPVWTSGSIVSGSNFSLTVYQDPTGSRPTPTFASGYSGTSGSAISADPNTASTFYFRYDGSHWAMIAFQAGIGVTTAPHAPNVSFSSAVATYALSGNATVFGFSGVISLPTTNADYAHLKRIDLTAYGPAGQIVPVCSLYAAQFSGTTIAFAGGAIRQAISAESWTLTAWAINDDQIATTSPATSTVPINSAAVVSFTSALEVGSRYPEVGTRLVHLTVGFVPGFSGGQLPQVVTYGVSADNGATFIPIGWKTITTVGQQVTIDRLAPAANGTWKVFAAAGAIGYDPSIPVASANLSTLFPGAIVSSGFSVAGTGLPSASALTTAAIATGAVNLIREDGGQYASIPGVTWTDPADTNAAFMRITVQRVDAAGNPAPTTGPMPTGTEAVFFGPNDPMGDVVVPGAARATNPLLLEYSPSGSAYTYVRYRMYLMNRNATSTADWSDSSKSVLQTAAWSGAAYKLVNIGALPAGKLDISRADATKILPGTLVSDVPGPSVGSLAISVTITNGPTTPAGVLTYGWDGVLSNLPSDPTFSGCQITVQYSGSQEGGAFATLTPTQTTFHNGFWPRPASSVNVTFRAYPISRDGKRGTPASTTVTITAGAAYALAGSQVSGPVASATASATVPGSGVQGVITAGAAGASVTVYQVKDTGGNVVMWAGGQGANYGIWAKNAWFGGSDPASAKIWLDSGGNAHFVGAVESGATITGAAFSGGSINVTGAAGENIKIGTITTGVYISQGANWAYHYVNSFGCSDGSRSSLLTPSGLTVAGRQCVDINGVWIGPSVNTTGGVICSSLSVSGSVSLSGNFAGTHSGTWSGSITPSSVTCSFGTVFGFTLQCGGGGVSYNGQMGLTTGAFAFLIPGGGTGYLRFANGGLVASTNF